MHLHQMGRYIRNPIEKVHDSWQVNGGVLVKVLIFKESRQISSCATKMLVHALVKHFNFAKTPLVSCQLEPFSRSFPSADPLCRRRLRRPVPARGGANFTTLPCLYAQGCCSIPNFSILDERRRWGLQQVSSGPDRDRSELRRCCPAA